MARQTIDQQLLGPRWLRGAFASLARGAAMGLFLAAAACDPGEMIQPAVSERCAAIGARCALPGGPIGVCQVTRCPQGESPPCYQCTPQH